MTLFFVVDQLGMASALETLCGQAFGAKDYRLLGIYLQRSFIVLFIVSLLLLPVFFLASPLLKLLGQPDDVAELSGTVSMCLIPLHFSFVFQFPLQRFLQSQLKNIVIAWVSLGTLILHVLLTWLIIYKFKLGIIGTALSMNIPWVIIAIALFIYISCGGCPQTWNGFSIEAFSGLWEFLKLSASSGVMLWYLTLFLCFLSLYTIFVYILRLQSLEPSKLNSGSSVLYVLAVSEELPLNTIFCYVLIVVCMEPKADSLLNLSKVQF